METSAPITATEKKDAKSGSLEGAAFPDPGRKASALAVATAAAAVAAHGVPQHLLPPLHAPFPIDMRHQEGRYHYEPHSVHSVHGPRSLQPMSLFLVTTTQRQPHSTPSILLPEGRPKPFPYPRIPAAPHTCLGGSLLQRSRWPMDPPSHPSTPRCWSHTALPQIPMPPLLLPTCLECTLPMGHWDPPHEWAPFPRMICFPPCSPAGSELPSHCCLADS
uniref:GLI family zinc finger 2 n=1 Tax=Canis lupus familiaris TaxID=9615 RepID=A0A8I3SAI2_CANLF